MSTGKPQVLAEVLTEEEAPVTESCVRDHYEAGLTFLAQAKTHLPVPAEAQAHAAIAQGHFLAGVVAAILADAMDG
jgi:hypothetical protein